MLVLSCLLALTLSFVLTPAVIGVSWRIGAVDIPCDGRRMHCRSIPRAGGIAIFSAFAVALTAGGRLTHELTVILCGGGLMLLVGLADDIFCLGAWTKFFFQIAAALACVLALGTESPADAAWGVFWVVTLTNAHNFIDGLDGLFAGCAAIEGAAVFLVFAIDGRPALGAPALCLGAACLGFRAFNRYPADIFAGDCGSATTGFLLGLLTLPLFEGVQKSSAWLCPLFLFAYPLTDLAVAVLRRTIRGKSPFCADRGHLHHRICDAGLMQPQCVGALMLITAGASTVAVLLRTERFLFSASLAAAALAFLLMRIRRFVEEFR